MSRHSRIHHHASASSSFSAEMEAIIFSLTFSRWNFTHCNSEFLTSIAFALPCVFTTSPFKPISGAPPYCFASNDFIVSLNEFLISSAPIFVFKLDINVVFTFDKSIFAVPSYSFKITFPTNASQTMTSASPFGMLRASILPIKLISLHAFNSGYVSFTS